MAFKNRVRKSFTQVSNEAARDKTLSLKAKGLLLVLLSFPDDWEYHMTHIQTQSADGRDAHSSAVRELEERGYLRRAQSRGERGRMGGSVYMVSDEVLTAATVDGFSVDGQTVDGFSVDGKPATTKTDSTKTDSTKTEAADSRAEKRKARAAARSLGSIAAAAAFPGYEEDDQAAPQAKQESRPLVSGSSVGTPAGGLGQATGKENVPGAGAQLTARQALGRCFRTADFVEALLTERADRKSWLDLPSGLILAIFDAAAQEHGADYTTPLVKALDSEALARRKKARAARTAPAAQPLDMLAELDALK